MQILRLFPMVVTLVGPAAAQLPINVEIDYMVDADHTHMPSNAEIDAVVEMFACKGYTLNVVIDDAIPHVDQIRCDFPGVDSFFECTSANWTTFREIKDANFDGPATGWHYCVFGHDFNDGFGTVGRSGIAEVSGNDLVVTLGSFTAQMGTPFDRASTFAHELGHNLGLRHWGKRSVGSLGNFAPNYPSVMSYQYQLNGVASMMECLGLVAADHYFKDLDYSSGMLPPLSEGALEEAVGVGIHEVDWNCNAATDAGFIAQDLDGAAPWCGSTGAAAFLRDYDDWSNIVDTAYILTATINGREHETPTCISADEARAFRSQLALDHLLDPTACPGPKPTLTQESCPNAAMLWVESGAGGVPVGTGEQPIGDLPSAVNIAPPDSILYLQPGIFTNAGNAITISKRLLLAGPGGAIVDP